MDKVYNIDEIFGSTNVKVQAVLAHNGCYGCYFGRDNPPRCFKPAYIGTCAEKGRRFIYIKINDKSLMLIPARIPIPSGVRVCQHQVTLHEAKSKDMSWNVYFGETLTCKDSGEPIKVERIE